MNTLLTEVRQTIINNDAKKLGISTEGKSIQNLAGEVYEARIKKEAKDLGIQFANKNIHELANEIRNKRIYNAAQKLGIKTNGKTTREIFREIMTNHADKAKELNLFPKERIHFLEQQKGGQLNDRLDKR